MLNTRQKFHVVFSSKQNLKWEAPQEEQKNHTYSHVFRHTVNDDNWVCLHV